MLVLLSFGLVIVATVLLVLGLLVSDGITLIYVSIGLSVGAAVLLVVAVRLAKPKGKKSAAPVPLTPEAAGSETSSSDISSSDTSADTGSETASAPAPVAVAAAGPASSEPASGDAVPASAPTGADAADGAWLASDDEWSAEEPAWSDDAAGEEIAFPIADYDDLTTEQIMPLLPQLYSDELDVVEGRETAGAARPEIIAELARLRAEGTLADGEVAPGAVVPATEIADAVVADDLRAGAAPTPAQSVARQVAEDESVEAEATLSADGPDDDDWDDGAPGLPIEGYDSLTYSQIVALLGELDPDELAEVRAHEASTKGRQTVLAEIDRRLGGGAVSASTPAVRRTPRRAPAPVVKAGSARKTAASATKVTPAKKAATASARKAATPVTKAPPVKKATPDTRTTKRLPAATAAPVRTTAVVKKAGPAKKTATRSLPAAKAAPVKRVAPVKKAAAAKKAAPAVTPVPAKKALAKKVLAEKVPAKKATKKR